MTKADGFDHGIWVVLQLPIGLCAKTLEYLSLGRLASALVQDSKSDSDMVIQDVVHNTPAASRDQDALRIHVDVMWTNQVEARIQFEQANADQHQHVHEGGVQLDSPAQTPQPANNHTEISEAASTYRPQNRVHLLFIWLSSD